MNRITLVTMCYDLNSEENDNRERKINHYLEKGELLMNLDVNLVFYVGDPKHVDYIRERRNKVGHAEKTQILLIRLQDLFYMDRLKKVTQIERENPITNMNKNKDTPLYKILMFNKWYCLEQAMKNNYFQTEHFGWLDFGISYRAKIPAHINKIVNTTSNKIKIGIFGKIWSFGIEDKNYYKTNFSILDAGFFTANRDYMQKFIDLFYKEIDYILYDEKLVPLDERMVAHIYFNNSNLFVQHYSFVYGEVFNRWLS